MSSKFDKVAICLFIIFAVICIGACFTPVIDLVKVTEVVEASEEQDAKVYSLKWSVGRRWSYRIVPVSSVESKAGITTYTVIGDGNIQVNDGVVTWVHDNGDVETFTNAALTVQK